MLQTLETHVSVNTQATCLRPCVWGRCKKGTGRAANADFLRSLMDFFSVVYATVCTAPGDEHIQELLHADRDRFAR